MYVRFWEGFGQTYGSNAARRLIPTLRRQRRRSVLGEKAEILLYCALIGYIHYEAPKEEQNFATLIEFINAMEVREDDEDFQNAVDLMFEDLKKKKPNHFAVRQYAKFKLAAGDVCSK